MKTEVRIVVDNAQTSAFYQSHMRFDTETVNGVPIARRTQEEIARTVAIELRGKFAGMAVSDKGVDLTVLNSARFSLFSESDSVKSESIFKQFTVRTKAQRVLFDIEHAGTFNNHLIVAIDERGEHFSHPVSEIVVRYREFQEDRNDPKNSKMVTKGENIYQIYSTNPIVYLEPSVDQPWSNRLPPSIALASLPAINNPPYYENQAIDASVELPPPYSDEDGATGQRLQR